jgi:hypothetical protein
MQNAVRYLWKAVAALEEVEDFELTGDIAYELYNILRGSDPDGAIFQFILFHSSLAYRYRMKILAEDCEPTMREKLYVDEVERLRCAFLNPEISPTFALARKFFAMIPNGRALVVLNRTMEQIKSFTAANKIGVICVIDKLSSDDRVTAVVMNFGEGEKLQSVELMINLDEAAQKYQLFQQIIATNVRIETPLDLEARTAGSPGTKGRKAKKSLPKVTVVEEKTDVSQSSFAKDVLKLGHSEFQKFVSDLEEGFQPMKAIMPEKAPDAVLVLSCVRSVHELPLECLSMFSGIAIIYKDFSVMSAMNRKSLSIDPPRFDP